jgi:hypothetical protein
MLMIFTVVMAIWGLTSKSYRSSIRLVTSQNALPMGLAFGYAYAGSVAMLTTVLNDVRNVMMAGHLIVVLTFLWMQPRLLQSTMGGMEAIERIKQVVSEALPASEASTVSEVRVGATVTEGANDVVGVEVHPNHVEVSGQNAAGPTEVPEVSDSSSIGEDVSWTEPEVLANDVAWDDDDVELLD